VRGKKQISVCQYLLYFGTGVVMLGVLGVTTGPILAGAGLLGLTVGLAGLAPSLRGACPVAFAGLRRARPTAWSRTSPEDGDIHAFAGEN
jgi:hypothetical protein